MSRGWQVVVFVLLLAVPVHARAQPEGASKLSQVQGSIADPQGRPVVGAEVWELNYTDRTRGSWEKRAVTGPAGQFSFQSSQREAYLSICHPDYLPEKLSPFTGSPTVAKVVLRPGGKISGRVVDANGRPVAGVQVRTNVRRHKPLPLGCSSGSPEPPCGQTGFPAVSDSEGSFAVTSLDPGWYDLGAFAEDYAPGWSGSLEARPGKKTAGVTIVVEPATRLTGRVLDSEGLPVADAEISTSGECAPFNEQPVHSEQDGSYSLRCVAPGLQRVAIRHPEHSTIFTDVRLNPGGNSHDWTLRRRVEVHGRIVTPDGTPVERAHLQSPRELSVFPADITDGSFTGWIDSGRPVEIWASAKGYAEGRTILPASRSGDRIENVEIRLGKGARLSGKFLGIAGTEASIYAGPVSRDSFQYKSGQVDAEGRYEIPGLLPGTWDIGAWSGHQELTRQVTVKPEDVEVELDLAFPPVFEVRGRVVPTPDTKTLSRSSLKFQSESSEETVWLSQDGSFTVELENGAYQVSLGDDLIYDGGPVVVADAPVAGLEIRLVPGARLQGRVRGLPPGKSFRDVTVQSPSFRERAAQTLAQDSYVMGGLTPGDWQVKVYLADRVVTDNVTLQPDEPLTTLDFDPAFGELTLSGRLTGGDPAVHDMQVELLQENPDITYYPDAREYGIFRFTRLRAGSYRLRVQVHGYSEISRDIELSADRDVVIDLSGNREE